MAQIEVAQIGRASAPPEWAAAYEQHATRLTRLATLFVGAADAHDLVTEAVLRAVSSEHWPTVAHPGAYLAQTLVHLAEDTRRSNSRRRRREVSVLRATPQRSAEIDVESMVVVRSALGELTPSQLAVVYLHYWEDLTVEQAAAQLDMRVGTARTHFDRAKKRLRSTLASEQGGRP